MWASDVSLILSEMPTLARGDIGHLHIEEPNNTTMGLCGFPQLQDIIFHLLSIIGASPPPWSNYIHIIVGLVRVREWRRFGGQKLAILQ